MATREELFAAVRLLRDYCRGRKIPCVDCVLWDFCKRGNDTNQGFSTPYFWPDPEEGGGEDG